MSRASAQLARARPQGDPHVAVAYLRVSKDEQNLGPEAQRAVLEVWAKREGIQIVEWHEDHGVSGGATIEDCPKLREAIAGLRTHSAGVLAVAKRDRMARDLSKAREIVGLVEVAGARLRSADGLSDIAGAAGQFSATLIDAVAEHERALGRERTKAALDAKRVRGESLGVPPFGFYKVEKKGKLAPDPREQGILRLVVDLRRDGMTEQAIVTRLTELGHTNRKGSPFTKTSIHRMLEKPAIATMVAPPAHPPIRRPALPLRDAEVEVDLVGALTGAIEDVTELALRLEDGRAELQVASLHHWLLRYRGYDLVNPGGKLEQLTAAFFECRGRPTCPGATLGATLQTLDSSVLAFVGESGAGQVLAALDAGSSALAVPVRHGARLSQHTRGKLMDPELVLRLSEGEMSGVKRTRAERVATEAIRLVYLFRPVAEVEE